MKRTLALLFGLLAAATFAQTVIIPQRTIVIPQQTIVIPQQTLTVTTTTPPPPVCTPPQVLTNGVCTTPVTNPPPPGVLWIYHNGTFSWPGDYSWNVNVNYKDTGGLAVGDQVSGPTDIAVNVIGPWGGFQPYAFPPGGTPFDTRAYKYLRYCTKPTQVNETHGTGFDADNDVPDGNPIPVVAGPGVTKYGPVPTVGKWGCYRIPLADFNLTNPLILKFNITDGTGNVPNLFYVDDVGFSQ